jgi:hypothetical protein
MDRTTFSIPRRITQASLLAPSLALEHLPTVVLHQQMPGTSISKGSECYLDLFLAAIHTKNHSVDLLPIQR